MDNHPIPQDITGFQFKLIGNMTVRQFVYLAIGAILAWLFFFIFGLPALLKWPLSIICITIGALFAFVPIDGRPMDTMLSNFLKAILSPTQFIYQKEGVKIQNQELPKSQPNNLPRVGMLNSQIPQPITSPQPTTFPTPLPAPAPVQEISQPESIPQAQIQVQPVQDSSANLSAPAQIQTPPPPPPIFSNPPVIPLMSIEGIERIDEPEEIKKKNKELKEIKEENEELEKELDALKKQLEEALKAKEEAQNTPPPAPIPPPQPPVPTPSQEALEKQLNESNRQREALEKELLTERAKANSPAQTFTPEVAKPTQSTQRVRSVPPGMEKSVGIPTMPEAPNLITGILKDPRGNPLQNILIEVKDQDANPVRAFKTNGLGKFASATSLSNGKYLITFEDSKEVNKFDAVEIELVGAPVMPLEIISVDPREELRRELFK